MSDPAEHKFELPSDQQAIRAKCFHPLGTFVEFPIEDVESSIPARFEKIVQQYPNNLAIVCDSLSLTYAQLNASANRVAHAIIDYGDLGSEPIALLFETRLALIVAMLGVLKAGKCFVLLDPAFPKARLGAILHDTGSKLILVEERTAASCCDLADDRCRLLDFGALSAGRRENDLKSSLAPGSLASISYTSGSSGEPKGVVWTHRNMLHQVMLFTNAFHHCDRDRLSYLTSGTAAAMVHPFFALLVGASVMPFDVKRAGILAFGRWLSQERISVCSLSTPLFRNFAESLTGSELFSDLRLLRLSSEAAYKADFELYRQRFPSQCLLGNGVGPAETGLLSTYLMDHDSVIAGNEIPIGYPVQDKDILLINDAGDEVGLNESGEIVVRSVYLAQGYWNRSDLTDAKFKGRFSESAARLFLTGDLGLRLPDGCLIHKGRKDFRAKIRGYGVEPAEVEAVLRQHPEVRETCVVAKPDDLSGESRLVAYIMTNPGVSLASLELRGFLKSRLPQYMIPSAFVALERMPLTTNGKVDRAALPSPEHVRPELSTPYSAPKGHFEEQLSKIWCGVLGLEATGVDDNFFDLGGDSLSVMRVITRVRDVLHTEIPIMEFFGAPTISALAELMRRQPPVRSVRQIALLPGARKHPLPLSFGQERLWFLEQLEPHVCRHNLVAVFRLKGHVDRAALEYAVSETIKRHESLRTVFRAEDGKPYQVVVDMSSLTIPFVDISRAITERAWEQEVSWICASEAQLPFDLSCGPLLRVKFVKVTAEHGLLVLVVHHLIFDGWSMDILVRELAAGCEAGLTKKPLQLPPVPVQYADFAIWQRSSLQGETLDAQLSFWRERLKDISALQLPVDRPRPRWRDGKAARRWFTLSAAVSRSLKEMCHEAGATMFMTLLAAYQTLLYRYSGQDDFCIGVPVAGRHDGALENTIGFFLNMLVLRADLAGNPTFLDLLDRVRRRCIEAYGHQDLPFERLVEELQPKRDLNQNPLFQVSFTLGSSATKTLRMSGLQVQELESDPGTTRFDLELFMEEREQGLHGFMAGSTDLFGAATIERMVTHFKNLLSAASTDPTLRIGELPLMDAAEKREILFDWNDTQRNYDKDKCIHQLFEEQVQRTPNTVAGVFDGRQLTYLELNRRANQLARYLINLGVKSETRVGICMKRSLDLFVGLLGVLKAGGAYVPLDPGYPRERRELMLNHAQISVLLTQKGSFEDSEWTREDGDSRSSIINSRFAVICWDCDWPLIGQQRDDDPKSEVDSKNLAYVIYTSGSTGQPKGVAIEHRNTVAFLSWVHSAFTPEELSGVLASTSICFDLSVFEIFAPLTCGGTIIMTDNALALTTMPEASRVSLLNTVPSGISELLNLGAVPSSVRVINLAGEPLRPEVVRRIYESTSVSKVHDLYGPSECTTYSTWARRTTDGPYTIGRPISNTQIYILDRCLQPVPIGVVGEIYIGGAGLARGYLNQPELTEEKFISNPFSEDAASRFYKTGDFARYLPDGNIEFLGRIDNQVKMRGYRIELGEIETALDQHRTVQSSVVVMREDTPGDKRLVAYVVKHEGATVEAKELRAYLKEQLPDYMMPSAFVFMDALPLTPNGKTDRRVLPMPEWVHGSEFVAPRTQVERKIAEIWAKVLRVDKVGIHDNFFDLGGHSLLATQVVSRLRKVLSLSVPLRTLFESPTIEQMAKAIAEHYGKRLENQKLEPMLSELESLPDEEAQRLLAEETASTPKNEQRE